MKILLYSLLSIIAVSVLIVCGAVYVFYDYGRGLPDHNQLASYEPEIMTRVHAGNGQLIAEYAVKHRVFVPINAMPKVVIDAFLSAEDKSFYQHFGIDPISVAGSIFQNLKNLGSDKRLVGASTITQQVAKNFLLTNENSIERKLKEAILAIRIERTLSKNRILELYLNEIYLGFGSYGVAAAALNYFNKSLDELELSEVAYLAALPKAPNNYHPIRKHAEAIDRRNWVISQMEKNNVIAKKEARTATAAALIIRQRGRETFVDAAYFGEVVRRWLSRRYGEKNLYSGGLSVRTTLKPEFQRYANEALQNGLQAYDKRHGWRGTLGNIGTEELDWARLIKDFDPLIGNELWKLAIVKEAKKNGVDIVLANGKPGYIPLKTIEWARRTLSNLKLGKKIKHPGQILQKGDVIFVEAMATQNHVYHLRQIPEVSGAMVVLDPHTGRILALSGGFNFSLSQFDRATQAYRQPGSAFKPFVYLAALDHGFTPSSLILDAPYVIQQGKGMGKWKPKNYSKKFYGPSTLRLGLEKSRNLMTVRIAQKLGINTIAQYARQFDINPDLPLLPSMALGAGETTVLKLTSAYAMLVNGGRYIEPGFIEQIQDRRGLTIYRRDKRTCTSCQNINWNSQKPPNVPDTRLQIADPRSAYQVVSMLEGVVLRGTGRIIKELGVPIAGKTGTTNEFRDAWFIGFTPDLAVGVYVGFDLPKSLGRGETGGKVAAPIFREFMRKALSDSPATPFRVPSGIKFVRIDRASGLPASSSSKDVIVEAFHIETQPKIRSEYVQDNKNIGEKPPILIEGVGGLY